MRTQEVIGVFSFQLRLLYECNPMAFIITQAGGLASDGTVDILDIQPKKIHQRSPIYLGSKEDVEDVLNIMKKHAKCYDAVEWPPRRKKKLWIGSARPKNAKEKCKFLHVGMTSSHARDPEHNRLWFSYKLINFDLKRIVNFSNFKKNNLVYFFFLIFFLNTARYVIKNVSHAEFIMRVYNYLIII